MLKKYLSIVLAVLLLFSVGCQQNAADTAEDAPAPVTEEPAPEPAPAGDEAPEAAKMKAGTYTGEAYGFSRSFPTVVSVTVGEDSIDQIEFVGEGDTSSMVDAVAASLFPSIIDNQSVAVDTVTGATLTSAAARLAVEDCLKQAFVAAGASEDEVKAFKNAPAKEGGSEEITTQVLVVGMGGSGTYTALRAAEKGAEVLAIEKQGRYGGTTALTSEIMSLNPERVQEKYNEGKPFIDKDEMFGAWMEYTEGDAKEDVLKMFFDNSGPAFDWLAIDHEVQFDFEPKPGFTPADHYEVKFQWYPNKSPENPGAPVYGANKREIAANFDKLVKSFTDLGGKYMLETEAYELITDESGAVTGVKAKNLKTDKEYIIKADAVVLATGGFLGNGEMTKKYLSDEYFPLKGEWKIYGSTRNDGKMLESAINSGAATYNIGMPPEVHMSGSDSFIPRSAGFPVTEAEGISYITGKQNVWSVADLPMFLGILPNSLAVGMDGKRFTAETGVAMLDPWIAGPNFYSIWSTDQLNEIRYNGLKHNVDGVSAGFLGYNGAIPPQTPLPETYDVLDAAAGLGYVFKADTIDALAAEIGVDPAALGSTVEAYNGFCAAGSDTELGKDAAFLEAIGEGPYYAVKMASYSYNTCAGLDVNTDLQVLNASGEPIKGLYAVGSDSAGVLFSEKKPYVTYGGANNGWVLTSGYVAGEVIADYVNAE